MATTEHAPLRERIFAPQGTPLTVAPASPALSVNAGSTTHFNVSYDDALGAQGAADAQSVLARCESDFVTLKYHFLNTTPEGLPFNVAINPGSFGASHPGCANTSISIGASSGPPADTATHAQTFENLTGLTNAFGRFTALMEAMYPTGSNILPVTDNPFPIPTYAIVSRATGKVLDLPASEDADGVVIQQYQSNRGRNQQWMFLPVGNGTFNIVCPISGKVFDIPGGNPADGVKLQQYHSNGALNQVWSAVSVGGGLFQACMCRNQ